MSAAVADAAQLVLIRCTACDGPLGVAAPDGSIRLVVQSRSLFVYVDRVQLRCHHCREISTLPLLPTLIAA